MIVKHHDKEKQIMLYEIKNGVLNVSISDTGAELQSVMHDGTEYLWQGNPEFWGGRAYNLFPICGRLWEGKYVYNGTEYEMNLHGFLRKSVLTAVKQSADSITFTLNASEKTLAMYPFSFEYYITYTLVGNAVKMDIEVINNGEKVMPFALGGHPGFNVPLADNEKFEDYYLDFGDAKLKTIYMSDACYTTKSESDFVTDGGKLPLVHTLFDRDAILLSGASKDIKLKSTKSNKAVTVTIPKEMKYVGIWHAPKKEAPYVCIEPWTSVPAYDGEVDDLSTKRDMFALPPNSKYNMSWSIAVD